MSGTQAGGRKIKAKLVERDSDYYRKIRSKRTSYPKHDGQFDKDSAKEAGKIGGSKSKRPKAKKLTR